VWLQQYACRCKHACLCMCVSSKQRYLLVLTKRENIQSKLFLTVWPLFSGSLALCSSQLVAYFDMCHSFAVVVFAFAFAIDFVFPRLPKWPDESQAHTHKTLCTYTQCDFDYDYDIDIDTTKQLCLCSLILESKLDWSWTAAYFCIFFSKFWFRVKNKRIVIWISGKFVRLCLCFY